MIVDRVFNACDGVILASPPCYEPETAAALREWMAETSRAVYCVGPMVPRGPQAETVEKAQTASADAVEDFLASTLKGRGERSLLYVRVPVSPAFRAHVDV